MSELSSVLHADDLPSEWRSRLSPYRFERDEVGRSSAGVFKLVSDGEPGSFSKSSRLALSLNCPMRQRGCDGLREPGLHARM